MLIHFFDPAIQACFSCEASLLQTYGADQARVLMMRVSELRAARNLADIRSLPQTKAQEILNGSSAQIALKLVPPLVLFVVPAHDPVPVLPNGGGLDWPLVTQITILQVTTLSTHGIPRKSEK